MPTEPDETTDRRRRPAICGSTHPTAGKESLHRFDGVGWVSASDERIDDHGRAGRPRGGHRPVRTSVDGKNRITQSTSTPPEAVRRAGGDIWERMSSMGSGGRSDLELAVERHCVGVRISSATLYSAMWTPRRSGPDISTLTGSRLARSRQTSFSSEALGTSSLGPRVQSGITT